MSVKVRIENTYDCGRESERVVEVRNPAPGEGAQTWWDEVVHDLTGDGHGPGVGGEGCEGGERDEALYTATILEVDDPELNVGDQMSWQG